MPGTPASSASNGVYGWCEDRAATEIVIERELEVALGLDENDSDVHRILAAVGRGAQRPRQGGVPPAARARPQPERRPDRGAAGRDPHLARPGGRRASIGSARRCASTRITRSASGSIWRAPSSSPGATPRRSNLCSTSARRTACITRCSPPVMPSWGMFRARRPHAAEVLKRIPGFTVREHCVPLLRYRHDSDLAHHCESLLKAGLPE